MNLLKTPLQVNPIIVKELRSRMRGGRAFITLTVSLLLMAAAMFGLLKLMVAASEFSYDIISARIGQSLFTGLVFLELVIVCAVTPAVTSGAISGEREKRTYEMLQATPLSPSSILRGKLVSALSYVFLLLFAAVPLASVVFVFGGVALRDMFKALLVLVVLTVSFGMLGIFMSALFKRTGRATVASFLVVIALLFAPLFAMVAVGVLNNGSNNSLMIWRWLLVPSPISMLSSVLQPSANSGLLGNIIPFLGGWYVQSAITPISQTSIPRPLYHYSVVFYLGLTLLLYLFATRLLQPARPWRLKRREILLIAGSVVIFAAVSAGLFLRSANRYEWVLSETTQATEPIQAMPVGLAPTPFLTANTPAVVEVTARPEQFTPTPVLPAGSISLSAKDQGTIYIAVIWHLLEGESANPIPSLFLVSTAVLPPGQKAAEPASIPLEVQKELAVRQGELPAPTLWVAGRQDALDSSGNIRDGGFILTFSTIEILADGGAQVTANIIKTGKASWGGTYRFENQGGVWLFARVVDEWTD
jgi:ABC-2 type transport system permease protein